MATSTWIDGSGSWTVNGNWSTGSFPNSASTSALIVDGTSAVTLAASVSVGCLQLSSGNTPDISSGSALTVFGSDIINAGVIQIAAGPNNAELETNGPVNLTGGGTVILSNSGASLPGALIAQAAASSPLTNVDNTIQGFGQIGGSSGLAFVNQATVDANVSGQALALDGGGITNSGLIEATKGGTLAISASVDNAGGRITANGGTVTIGNSAAITGGTLSTAGGGVLEATGATTLSGVAISSGSTYTIASGAVTQLVGTITNAGVIQIAAGPNNAELETNGPVNLTGGGTVILSNSGASLPGALIAQAAVSSPLTNVDNTIQGFGQIGGSSGLAFVNQATVDANVSGQALALDGGGITNSGLIEATKGGTLAISASVDNTGGRITANGGTVTIGNSAAITGGTLSTASGGVLEATGATTLSGVAISSGSTYTIASGAVTQLVGTVTDAGAINGGGATEVAFGSGTNQLILAPEATFGGAVVGGGANTTLELAKGSGPGTLDALGTTFANFGTVIVDPGATWTVDALASALPMTTIVGNGGASTVALTTPGSVNLGGVSKFATIDLAAGTNTVTVTDTTLSGGSVALHDGASGDNSVSAAGDTVASKGKTLTFDAGAGTDSFTGGFENDKVNVVAAAVGGDVLTGGSGGNTLTLTTAGTVNLGGVSKFATIDLAAGTNTVTVTDMTLSGGTATIKAGATGNNTVSTAGDTVASKGKTLTYDAGSGTDTLTGGFENDKVGVAAAAVGGDVLSGGSGSNTLILASAGIINLGGVSKFATINLAAGDNTITVTDTTLSRGSVTIKAGASGNNSISAAGDTAASKGKTLTYTAGTGTDSFAGGVENDKVSVTPAELGGDVLTGGSSSNTLTLTSAGTVNLGAVSKFATINLAAGNSTVTVTDTTLTGGSVTIRAGASGNNSVSAAGDTAASKGKTLIYDAGTGTDSFTGGFENDGVHVSAAAVGGDVLTGGSGANTVTVTTADIVNLGGVSKFGTVNLAAGNSTVTVTDTTLSGGSVTIRDGASGNNSVSAAGDTAASKGKTLTYDPGSGTDHFTGGFENDKISASAAAVGGDVLTGGNGTSTLTLTTAGTVNLRGVSKFGTIDLAVGNNTVTVTDTTLSGGSLTIKPWSSGNETISAAGDTAASKGTSLIYNSGSGADSFTGGFENDTIYAGTGLGTYTAGSGSDTFVFIKSSLPTQTLDNFQLSSDDILVYGTHSSGGFNLGTTDNGLNPATPTAIDPSIFVANATGAFTSSSQRFAYDTSNGQLFYSATGSNSSDSVVATLTGAPAITAGNMLFEH